MNIATPALTSPEKATEKASTKSQSETRDKDFFSSNAILTVSCACGGGCPNCSNRKRITSGGTLQTKLQVGAPDDTYEQEADRIADKVMATPIHKIVGYRSAPYIQRLTSQTVEHRSTAPRSVEGVLSGSGRSLDVNLKNDMSQRFGQDFSQVRIHTGAAAEQSARDVNAYAYTVGHNIVFGAGQFAPNSQQGKRLLAHELAHVVQQSENRSLGIQRYIAEDVLTTQITYAQAEEMTHAELGQEMQRLRDHLSTFDRTSPDYMGAVENLHILENVALSRMSATARRISRPRTASAAAAQPATAESPSPVVTALGSTEYMVEASRMAPDELSGEITRLRALMTGVSDDSFESLANRERLIVFETELSNRNALTLEHVDSVHDARERFDLDMRNVFVSGFSAGALGQIPPGEIYDFFHHDLPENPVQFTGGCEEGVGLGFIEGANNLVEIPRSIFELFERTVMYAIQNEDTLDQLGDDAVHEFAYQILGQRLYTRVAADTGYLDRRIAYERQINDITAAIQRFSEELAHDPTIVVQWSGDLGLALGQSFGRSVTEDFLRAAPHQQGVIVGRIIGQALFEIILQLVLAVATEGVGNAIRASTEIAHGFRATAELITIIREMVEASPAVQRLLRLVRHGGTGGEELADVAADLARIVERSPDLPSSSRAGTLDSIVEDSRTLDVSADEPPNPTATHTPESSTSRGLSVGDEVEPLNPASAQESVRTVEPESTAVPESASSTESPLSDPIAIPEPEAPPRTMRGRIEARRRTAASSVTEIEEIISLSNADSSVLSGQFEDIRTRLRAARRRRSTEEVELLEQQRDEVIRQMYELIDERRLLGRDWHEARLAGEAASVEYFLSITNSARRYYPDDIEIIFGAADSSLTVEHIVPRSRIFGIEGFENLTRDQQISLFAWGPNLRRVPSSFNSARGATPYARLSRDAWRAFTTDESIIRGLAEAEVTLEAQIEAMIASPSTIPVLGD